MLLVILHSFFKFYFNKHTKSNQVASNGKEFTDLYSAVSYGLIDYVDPKAKCRHLKKLHCLAGNMECAMQVSAEFFFYSGTQND